MESITFVCLENTSVNDQVEIREIDEDEPGKFQDRTGADEGKRP